MVLNPDFACLRGGGGEMQLATKEWKDILEDKTWNRSQKAPNGIHGYFCPSVDGRFKVDGWANSKWIPFMAFEDILDVLGSGHYLQQRW